MLENLKLPLVGRHHSGIDDARNIAQIVTTLMKGGLEFNQSMILDVSDDNHQQEQYQEFKPFVPKQQKMP